MADVDWSGAKVRQAFIDFFVEKEHTFIPSSSVIPHNDPTLLFANAGMNQFKSIFLCTVDPNSDFAQLKRAVNSQKCIRAGGKHNDLDDVGKDNYHHTFFEMLGTWSFGDYFKKEAIDWAWELLTSVYKLPADRLYATYFEGDPKNDLPPDTQARDFWLQYLPASHVIPGNAKDNFWEMGDTGPCGPCTELHFDRIGGREAAHLVNKDDPTVLEIWNLVFMQFERKGPNELVKLPACHVDTGMGLERLASILQGKMSNYDIDLFTHIFEGIAVATKSSPYEGKMGSDDVGNHDTAYRVLADHIRMLSLAIADGQKPGSDGRAYVMRRVLRRAVRYGTECLDAPPGFFHQLVPYVVETLGDAFPTLVSEKETIIKTIKYEEQLFTRTLRNGLRKFNGMIAKMEKDNEVLFSPHNAAFLNSTFGFPADLTRIKVEELGKFKYDEQAVNELLEAEKIMSEEAHKKKKESKKNAINMDPTSLAHLTDVLAVPHTDDSFKFNQDDISGKVLAIFSSNGFLQSTEGVAEGETVGLILDATNFYAESGGQIYDTGSIRAPSGEFHVQDVQNFGGYILHSGVVAKGVFQIDDSVDLTVDIERRQPVMANHTTTHMLNHALRKVVGDHTHQKGSVVLPKRFRFDYQHGEALNLEQIEAIQKEVVDVIDRNLPVSVAVVPLSDAREIFGVRAMFGEQYPNPVRVVSIGVEVNELLRNPKNEDWFNYAVEFCGGTHLTSTAEAGNFVITSEEPIAAGIRRITAVTGQEAIEARELSDIVKAKIDIARSVPGKNLEPLLAELRKMVDDAVIPAADKLRYRAELVELTKVVTKSLKEGKNAAQDAAAEFAQATIEDFKANGARPFVVGVLEANGANVVMTACIRQIAEEFPDTAVLLLSADLTNKNPGKQKVVVVSHASAAAIAKGLKANDWAKAASAPMGGKGGGKDTTAQGSGPDTGKVQEAVDAATAYAKERL